MPGGGLAKQNRVDLLAEDEQGVLYLMEIQNETEVAYFHRMFFGTSKLVSEYINRGQGYENIRKVYNINIVLEQWIYVLSTGDISEDADAPGLSEAHEKLQVARMTKAELETYYRHLD